MSDRDKFIKVEKAELIKFCKTKQINTGHCFAKIDFVNEIIEKGYKYTDYINKKPKKGKKSTQTVSLKGPKSPKTKFPSPLPKAKLKKTATRFCVDAHIDQDGELDVAEFILAAQYIGTDANNDQLMDIFMEHVENADDDQTAKPKQIIKDLMQKVENKHGKTTNDDDDDGGAITTQETSVYAVNEDDIYTENMANVDNNIDDFLVQQQQDQQLEIARNLMEMSMLTRQEIAEMTGVDANDLKQYESDEYETESESDYETESDTDNDDDDGDGDGDGDNSNNNLQKKQHVKTKTKTEVFEGVKIIGSHGKNLLIEKKNCEKLKQIINDGSNGINNSPDDVILLLQTLSDAINLAPGAMRRAKTMAKLNLGGLKIADDEKKKEPELTFPAKYRVVITPGALCKSHKDRNEKDSTVVARLPTGVEVMVEEINGNRARISSPHNGWCSIKHSTDKRTILERSDNKHKSKEMQDAIKKDKTRKTQIEILKNVTTLNEKTVVRMLEKCDWNLRLALDSFFIAKFKTQEYEERKLKKQQKKQGNENIKRVITTEDMFKDNDNDKKNKGWFKSWKTFANDKNQ